MTLYFPTREDVQGLKVGDYAPDCFGREAEVIEITYSGDDIHGRAYVGYYTAFGSNHGRISMSVKQDCIVSTVRVSDLFTSAEIDGIQYRACQTHGAVPRYR